MTMKDVLGFFDEGYEEAVRGNRIPDGVYHLKITTNLGAAPFSTDDRPAVQLGTEVASGEHAGRNGPRLVLQLGGNTFTTKAGVQIEITAEQAKNDLMADVRAIHGVPAPKLPPGLSPLDVLVTTADRLEGDEFIGTVRTNANGFQTVGYYRNIDDPPKGFILQRDMDVFRV